MDRASTSTLPTPLPEPVQALREALYPPLSLIANQWQVSLKLEPRFPEDHPGYIEQCHRAGQQRPTPLILKYGAGDYNSPAPGPLWGTGIPTTGHHPPVPGAEKSSPAAEFVLTEQRPRVQSRAHVVPLELGDTVIFAVHQRPAQGPRGFHRVNMRHGVSEVSRGERYTLGVIFHDAS